MKRTKWIGSTIALLVAALLPAIAQAATPRGIVTTSGAGIIGTPSQNGYCLTWNIALDLWRVTACGDGATTSGIGTKNGATVSVVESGNAAVHKTALTLAATPVATVDAAAAGAHGSTLLYTFPAGIIQNLGCVYNLTTLAGAGGIADGAALVGALGTVATVNDNDALTTTEADFIASTAGTLTAGAGALAGYGSAVATAHDGHTTAKVLRLNIAVPAADHTATADSLAVSGTVTCVWSSQGDF